MDTEFKRKKQRGCQQKVRRVWQSPDGYRIVWRKEVAGVSVPAAFQVMVRSIRPNYNGEHGECWDFVGKRLYRARKAAEDDIAKHRKRWQQVVKATGIRGVQKALRTTQLPYSVPEWAMCEMPETIYQLFVT